MRQDDFISKLTSKSQTVVPQHVRRQLGLKPGDRIRYHVRGKRALIEKVTLSVPKDDPFVAFDEWGSEADERAFRDL